MINLKSTVVDSVFASSQEKGNEMSSLPDTSMNTPVFNSTANDFNDVLIDSLEEIKDHLGGGDNSRNNSPEMDDIVSTMFRKQTTLMEKVNNTKSSLLDKKLYTQLANIQI